MRAVTLSFGCNNACVYCAQGELRRSAAPIDAEAAVRALAASVQPGETIAIVGGEPTLDERLPDFIRMLAAAGAGVVVVQTNGRRLAYRSYARLLAEASPRLALDVSLAGSTEPMHDYHTTAPGSFKQTVLGLRNARAEGIRASVSCAVTRSNFRHLSDVVRLCHALAATAVRLVPAQPFGRAAASHDRVVPAPELVAPYLAQALAEGQKLGVAVRVDATGAPEEGAAGAFAGLGLVESEAPVVAEPRPEGAAQGRRSLAIFGRPAPGRREERIPSRRTGAELRAILPALFDGAAPRDVAEVVAAEKEAG